MGSVIYIFLALLPLTSLSPILYLSLSFPFHLQSLVVINVLKELVPNSLPFLKSLLMEHTYYHCCYLHDAHFKRSLLYFP